MLYQTELCPRNFMNELSQLYLNKVAGQYYRVNSPARTSKYRTRWKGPVAKPFVVHDIR